MHAEVFSGPLAHTLKKIEKSFENEQKRLANTRTVSHDGHIESIHDQTLNDSVASLRRLHE